MASYKQVIKDDEGNGAVSLKDLLNKSGNESTVGQGTTVKETPIKSGSGSLTGFKPTENAPISTMGASTGTAQPASATNNAGGYQYADYQESDTVRQAEAMLNEQLANKPGEYQSAWQQQLNDAINKILNREKFSYDLNGDALYQQDKDKYIQQGKMAMMDTMGQAQAMTGGYGNSYAQSVGQQAYQSHLQELNDIVPELYQMAYDQYAQEGQDMYNQAALMAQQEDRDYGRYQDAMNAWQAERDYLAGRYDSERDYDYGKYTDERDFGYGAYIDDRNYQYQQEQDAIEAERWQKEFEEAQRQYNEQMGLTKEQWAWEKAQAEAGGNGGNGGNGGDDTTGILWYQTGTYDDNGNPIFRNSEGKTQAFGPGINPYTGTKHRDAGNGTFSNGYQPDNIDGTKLKSTEYSTDLYGKEQTIWTANGKYWLWNGRKNRYDEVDPSVFGISEKPENPAKKIAGSGSAGAGGGKTVQHLLN